MRKFSWIQALAKWNGCVIVYNPHLTPCLLYLPHTSSEGEEAGVLLIYSPTHLKPSVVYYKGNREKCNAFQKAEELETNFKEEGRKITAICSPEMKMKIGGFLRLAWVSFLEGLSWEGGERRQHRGGRASRLLQFSIPAQEPTEPSLGRAVRNESHT